MLLGHDGEIMNTETLCTFRSNVEGVGVWHAVVYEIVFVLSNA